MENDIIILVMALGALGIPAMTYFAFNELFFKKLESKNFGEIKDRTRMDIIDISKNFQIQSESDIHDYFMNHEAFYTFYKDLTDDHKKDIILKGLFVLFTIYGAAAASLFAQQYVTTLIILGSIGALSILTKGAQLNAIINTANEYKDSGYQQQIILDEYE